MQNRVKEKHMMLDTGFHDEDWDRIDSDWNAWWSGELERPLVMINGVNPLGLPSIAESLLGKLAGYRQWSLFDLLDKPLPAVFDLSVPVDKVVDAYTRLLSVIRCYGDCWPRWWPNFGPGIIAGFLGCNLETGAATVWFDRDIPVDLDTWEATFDENNVWLHRVEDISSAAVERWSDRLHVGISDIGGNLDILASLRGTETLLMDTLDNPEGVERQLHAITGLWLRYYSRMKAISDRAGRGVTSWAHIRAQGSTYMLQCDFAYMISPDMFDRFVMPDLKACCDAIEYPFYHLDGKGQIPHMESLLSLKKLRGIQWIPGEGAPPPEEWIELLQRIRAGGKLIQLYVTAKGALEIVRRMGGKGMALYIEDRMDAGQSRNYMKRLIEENRKHAQPYSRQ